MKRTISLILALLMVFSSVLMMVACDNGTSGENETKKPVEQGGNTSETGHSVPKQDFDGETFNSLCYRMNTTNYYYFTDDEAAGDPIKEALWQRTELIKDHLNCELTHDMRSGEEAQTVSSKIHDQAVADSDDFQQVLLHTIYGVSSLVTNGQAYDFAALPNVNLDAEWWDKEDMESLRVSSIYAYGRSDFVISAPHAVIFNKTMVDDLNLESPYDLVNDYQWTIDKMMSMATAAVRDVNNDGRYTGIDDIFGLSLSEISKFNSFLISCDQPISKKNEEGRLELVLNTEKTVKIIEKFYDFNSINGAVYVAAEKYPATGINHEQLFGEGRSLFVIHDLSILEAFRSYEVDTGIAPYPMYDENQGEYKSMDWGPMWAIPATIKNPTLVGSVVELYSYYSADTIVPAYYDKVLEGKLAQDLESRKMLELIFDSVSFDPVNNYFGFHSGIGDLAFVIGKLVFEGSSKNFASFYKGRANGAETRINDYYKDLEKNGRL